MAFIYVASPYSHPNSLVMHSRFEKVEKFVAGMLKNEEVVYSPIVHCHELARKYEFPTRFEYWQKINRGMLSGASKLVVYCMKGWSTSAGVRAEIEFAKQCGIPVEMVQVDE